jgi:hypothetical protein
MVDIFNDRYGGSQWNVEAIGPYIPGVNLDKQQVGQIWICPNVDIPAYNQYIVDNWWPVGYFMPRYSYFARVSEWQAHATHPDLITDDMLVAGRLVMNDILYRWHVSAGWRYNHGPSSRNYAPAAGGYDYYWDMAPTPRFAGGNNLYGDGAVRWRSRDSYDLQGLADLTAPHTTAAGNDLTFY